MLRPVSTPAVYPQKLNLDYYGYTGQASSFDWEGRLVQAIIGNAIGVPITFDVGTTVSAYTAAPLATCSYRATVAIHTILK